MINGRTCVPHLEAPPPGHAKGGVAGRAGGLHAFLARACLALEPSKASFGMVSPGRGGAPISGEPWVELARLLYQRGGVGRCAVCRRSGIGARERPRTHL